MKSMNAQHEIEQRAFEIYEQRGRTPGNELEDWLRAEQEIASKVQGEQQRIVHSAINGHSNADRPGQKQIIYSRSRSIARV